ncbi:hypothetical protein HYW59_00500 [Candidatus Kaiserbacteria bacterium]|nr:hypothetical protein [Candidatus Kaiserbacteria bacterium]
MKSPTIVYAIVGLFVGGFLNYILTGGSTQMGDLLTGAIFGLAIGLFLGIAKYNILDRK